MNERTSLALPRFQQAIQSLHEARERYRGYQIESILHAADHLRTEFERAWNTRIHSSLRDEFIARSKVGWRASFIRIAGQSNLEKPFNRLLGWWADVDAEHGLGWAFLRALARKVKFKKLDQDLKKYEDSGKRPLEFFKGSETKIPRIRSTKMPDLLIITARAVLLIENKVESGESGDQYGPYLELVDQVATEYAKHPSRLSKRAVLCSRSPLPGPDEEGSVPDGWWKPGLSHRELAEIFMEISGHPAGSTWGRISALLSAMAFDEIVLDGGQAPHPSPQRRHGEGPNHSVHYRWPSHNPGSMER